MAQYDPPIRWLAVLVTVALCPAAVVSAATLVGISTTTNSLYEIDMTSGEATLMSTILGRDASAPGASFLDGELYASDVFDPGFNDLQFFGTIELVSGAFGGISDQNSSPNWQALASDEGAALLYTIDRGDNDILKSITAGGFITAIGTGSGIEASGMAYDDGNGLLYAYALGLLYVVDTDTGDAELIGDTGQTDNLAGLAYDEENDVLFLNVGPPIGSSRLYTVNVNTGFATLVGPNNVNRIDSLAWIIPEPGSFVLLIACGLLITPRRNR